MLNKYKKFVLIMICCTVLGVVGCQTQELSKKTAAPAGAPPAGKASMANPAAQKCLDDGYMLEPILTNGIPTGHFCINPDNGKRCEVWDYYRGECRLSND